MKTALFITCSHLLEAMHMSKSYAPPRLIAKGNVVEITQNLTPGIGDPMMPTTRGFMPSGSTGFML